MCGAVTLEPNFSQSILVSQLESELNICYLDDGTTGDEAEVVRCDLEVVNRKGADLGLQLNEQKSEVIGANAAAKDDVLSHIPGAMEIDPTSAILLGSPIGDTDSISGAISQEHNSCKLWQIGSSTYPPMLLSCTADTPSQSQNCCISLDPHPFSSPQC